MRRLVAWLERAGQEWIFLIDNGSAFELLLEYYESHPHSVVRLGMNVGPQDFWVSGIVTSLVHGDRYVVTDPDVVPTEDCPLDALDYFSELLDRHQNRLKVGSGLRTDDLPMYYKHRDAVQKWEAKFWEKEFLQACSTRISTQRLLCTVQMWTRSSMDPPYEPGLHMLFVTSRGMSTSRTSQRKTGSIAEGTCSNDLSCRASRPTGTTRDSQTWLKVRAGGTPRSYRFWSRLVRYVRNGYRRSGYTDL